MYSFVTAERSFDTLEDSFYELRYQREDDFSVDDNDLEDDFYDNDEDELT